MRIGTTYSWRQVKSLGLDHTQAFGELLDLGLDTVRLCGYWDELEPRRGEYKFERLEAALEACESKSQRVVVTLGAKAPRWPEFYFPGWVERTARESGAWVDEVLIFLAEAVRRLGRFECIKAWQVENEPLDEAGPERMKIEYEWLRREVEQVKSLDERPVVVSLWGNDLFGRGYWERVSELADVVGVDVYFRQLVGEVLARPVYMGPRARDGWFKKLIGASKKPVWITELQAEPWEASEESYRSGDSASMSPSKLEESLGRVEGWGVERVLLWGYEYWLWRKEQGDRRYWEVVERWLGGNG